MHNLAFTLLLAVQPNTPSTPPVESVAHTAAECAVYFKIRQANAATDEQKTDAEARQAFMVAIMKDKGMTVEDFVKIGDPYKREFDKRVAAKDLEFIQSEGFRCDGFAKRENEKLATKPPAK
jgi:hypothetical protein